MIDSFVSYKFNRYKTKLESAVKRMKGEMICDSELVTQDLLEPQVLVNSLSEKVINNHSYLLDPFKYTYALKEIKNVITDTFLPSSDLTRFDCISLDTLVEKPMDRMNYDFK